MKGRLACALPLLALLLLPLCGCASHAPSASTNPVPVAQVSPSPSPSPVAWPEKSVAEFISEGRGFSNEKQRQAALSAWRGVAGSEHYRLAHDGDLNLPAATDPWGPEPGFDGAFEFGEFSGHDTNNLILIAVDRTKNVPERFSLLILLERPSGRYEVHWVYRDRDLSSHRLARHSGNVYLAAERDGQMLAACDIQWDRESRAYTCE